MFRKHQSIQEVGVCLGELEDGDHVYILRRRWGNRYVYSHHGIYDKEKQIAIHFTASPDVGKELENLEGEDWAMEEVEEPFSGGTGLSIASVYIPKKIAKSVAVNAVVNWMFSVDIRADKIGVFEDKEEKFLRMTYGMPDGLEGQETHPEQANPDEKNAVLVARWFRNHEGCFGEYNLYKWNCEHFATFCKTTKLTPADLDRALEDNKLSEDFLKENSRTRSTQAR